ncbi:MAG: hypothetical protein WC054_13320 [Candidatus Nanopelagicales bacterium]
MSYTQLAIIGILVVIVGDLFVLRTRLLTRKIFWVSYAIIVFFQLVSNGLLTGFRIVRYNGEVIIGSSTPVEGPPPFIGDGRLVFAPVEDLMFGFALVLLTLSLWVFWGRIGVQRLPMAGPPRFSPGRKRDSESSP